MRQAALLLVLSCTGLCAQPILVAADLKLLEGKWTGELTYINYSDGAPSTIPATLLMEPLGGARWRMGHGYTEEPQANELDTVALAADGRSFDQHAVVDVEHPAPDSVHIVLSIEGTDDNRPAMITKIWRIGRSRCTMRKEVMFLATSASPAGVPFFRHEYRFVR